MLSKWTKRGLLVAFAVAMVAAAVFALIPRPIAVDVATVEKAALSVSVTEEGLARVRDVFQVSTPVAGRLGRSHLHVGDAVKAGETVIAAIYPAAPPFLDARSQVELAAAVEGAAAAVKSAEAEVAQAEAGHRLAKANLDRAQPLAKAGTITESSLQSTTAAAETAAAALDQARAALQGRQSELGTAEARLMQPGQEPPDLSPGLWVAITAPASGVVLKLPVQDEQVVPAGTVIALVGDPKALEVVVPLLSRDAVGIRPGAPAVIEDWGGPPLAARVRSVDPSAFTKTSALGIDEQRANVLLDMVGSADAWAGLGHEFRVTVSIETWASPGVLRVPLGALFRSGANWTVFRAEGGRARQTTVTIDHRTTTDAEVTAGLAVGDVVILHPSDRISDGVRIERQE